MVREFIPGITFPGRGRDASQPAAADGPVTPTKEISSNRFRALPTVRVSDVTVPVLVAPANPNRVALMLRVQTPTGYVTIGGPPDDGGPQNTSASGQFVGLPLFPYETVTLETTGEVWAIADNSYSATPATWLRVVELLSPVADR